MGLGRTHLRTWMRGDGVRFHNRMITLKACRFALFTLILGSTFFSDWFSGAHEMPLGWPGDASQGLNDRHILPSRIVQTSSHSDGSY